LGVAGKIEDLAILKSMRDVVAFEYSLVQRDPKRFLAYILYAEYVTVALGPDWLADMNQGGVREQNLSAIANHVRLDQDHVSENFEVIPRFFSDLEQDLFLDVARESHQKLKAFFAELATIPVSERPHENPVSN
jgi:hypothetical protein